VLQVHRPACSVAVRWSSIVAHGVGGNGVVADGMSQEMPESSVRVLFYAIVHPLLMMNYGQYEDEELTI